MVGAAAFGKPPQPLTVKELKKLLKADCAVVHVWATWCQPCIVELPAILQWIPSLKHIEPVVVDISSPFAQKQFSVRWVEEALKPSFKTYVMPAKVKEHDYGKVIDPKWPHYLPYTALVSRGRLVQRWLGPLKIEEATNKVVTTCRPPKKK